MSSNRKEYMRKYQLQWLKARRNKYLAENGPCKNCGSWERLEIHHRDRLQRISNSIWSWTKERRDAELTKCDVLCNRCHAIETHKQRSIDHPIIHGTNSKGYMRNCRYDLCHQAAKAEWRIWKQKRK